MMKTDFDYIINLKTEFINDDLSQIKERLDDESNGIQRFPKSNSEIIKNKYGSLFNYSLSLIFAQYSKGINKNEIKQNYLNAINYLNNSWGKKSYKEFTYGDNPTPYFSYDQYWKLITMLSLGILLEVPDEEFNKLVKIREKVEKKDYLLDTIISYHMNTYKVSEDIMKTNLYKELVKVIQTSKSDKITGVEMLKKYLSKNWYKDNKEMYWYNYHKDSKLYFGYWSFESGALVKILNLDDSILKEQKYYPYDMVHWNNKNCG